MNNTFVIIETTYAHRQDAIAVARALVDKRYAACCHLIPMTSCYRWQGVVEEAEEVTIRCKTTQERAKEVVRYITTTHPYAIPEIAVMTADSPHQEYRVWMEESVAEEKG